MTCTTATATARDFPAALSAAGPTAAAPVDLDAGDELRPGRRFPYSTVGDWVVLAPVSDRAIRIYWLLRAHVNTLRGDDRAWPGQKRLAAMIGVKKVDTVISALRELQMIGAIEVETVRTRTGRRNIYTVHETPPDGYTAPTNIGDFTRHHAAATAGSPAAGSPAAGSPAVVPSVDTPAPGPSEGPEPGGPSTCPATTRTGRNGHRSPGHGGYPKNREYPPTDPPQTYATPDPEGGVSRNPGVPIIPDFGVELPVVERPEAEGGTRARPRTDTPPPVEPGSGPRACGAPHPDHRTEARPEARAERRSETRPAGTKTEPRPRAAETAQETPRTGAAGETQDTAIEAVSGALSAPGSAPVLRPEPERPETWKCDRHLAAPDPADRPCRGCKTVREHCERRDTQLRLDAAAARAAVARAARAAVKACTWCDEAGDVLDPATGHCYEPVIRCDHHATTPERAAEIADRPAPTPVVATAATRAAAIAAFRNRHRPDQATQDAA